jgi:glyoxylase-like metal-dependent hydrolase (beta-lactamase superfamily II)
VFQVRTIELSYNRCYVVDSNGVRVLVDAGPDYDGAWEAMQDNLDGRLPDVVLVTHGHNDHAGLGKRWQELGVPVLLDENDHHLARAPRLSDPAEWQVFEDFVRTSGAPVDVQREVVAGLEQRRIWAKHAAKSQSYSPSLRGTRWPTGIRMLPYEPNGFLEDIDVVAEAMSDAGIGVLFCPGHTPGNTVIVSLTEEVLFSGDQLLPDITPTPGIQATAPRDGEPITRYRSLPAFVASLELLQSMDWAHCFPGHGTPFDDVRARIDENLAGIEERSDRVMERLVELGEARVYEVAASLYPRAVVRRFWQIVATVQGNLDLLEEKGRIRSMGGVYRTA